LVHDQYRIRQAIGQSLEEAQNTDHNVAPLRRQVLLDLVDLWTEVVLVENDLLTEQLVRERSKNKQVRRIANLDYVKALAPEHDTDEPERLGDGHRVLRDVRA